MITKNFKNFLAMVLLPTAGNHMVAGLPVKKLDNTTAYVVNYFRSGFPYDATSSPTLTATYPGISVGTDGTAATENDYQLGSTITSGVSLSLSDTVAGVDNNGDPYLEYTVTVTNIGNSTVTVREIGYKQRVYTKDTQGAIINPEGAIVLFDRTVLATPLEIPAGKSGVIVYRLTTDATA